jgi:hypothetical protein
VKTNARGAEYFDKLRGSPIFDASKRMYPPGWGAHDTYGDPMFQDLAHGDVRPGTGSAAIDAGMPVPATWPDTLRALDRGKPDVGALPKGAAMLQVGPTASPRS